MSCIYEVTLQIEPALIAEYDPWLREHVADMLTLPGFQRARIHAVEPEGTDERIGRVVYYQLADRAAFDAYLSEHAAAMRQQGMARFGDRVSASRRILRPLQAG